MTGHRRVRYGPGMQPQSRRARPIACMVLALAGFAGTASLVRAWVPLPSRGAISDKLEYFFEHGGEYDAVLFGTSRIVGGVDPLVLESELARFGIELKVFNLGLPAVGAYEVDPKGKRRARRVGLAEKKPLPLRNP